MELSRVDAALALLREHYGEPPAFGESRSWSTLLRVVLTPGTGQFSDELGEVLRSDLLQSPESVAAVTSDELADLLVDIPRSRQKATLLTRLAGWWLSRFGEEPDPEWNATADRLRSELIALPGINLEMADRLLLFVGGFPVYPVDRATIRIAARHGWLGVESEYEEWQAYAGLPARSIGELQRLSLLMGRVGRDYCGPVPHCETCPLRSLLPLGGPYDPE